MEQIIDLFQFDLPEIIISGSLSLLFIIQIFFYSYFYNKPYSRYKKMSGESHNNLSAISTPSVSIIIISTDDHFDLEQNLPLILEQDYQDYEVIVVNNGLTDDTDILLKGLKLKYPHLYHTFLPKHSDEEAIRKKLAFMIGIKAAKKDVLLFTEADTKPASNKWIALMMQQMGENKDIVLGYCNYEESKSFINRIARYKNLLSSIQNLSAALINMPIMGIYRNIAYRRELFFSNKGFSSVLNYKHCESLFINTIMTSENTAVCLDPEGFVSTRLNSFGKWKQIEIYLNRVRKNIKKFWFLPKAFSFEALSRQLFYFASLFFIASSIIFKSWGMMAIVALLLILRIIIGTIIINKQSKHFGEGKFLFSYIVMDIFQPFYSLYFRSKS